MSLGDRLAKAANHGINYFFGRQSAGAPQPAAMPPAGSSRPPALSPTPNESIVLKPSQGIQADQYGILGPNAPTGPGAAAGTGFAGGAGFAGLTVEQRLW